MLDHVGIEVADLGVSKSFYAAALEPVGIVPLMEFDGAAGFGKQRDGKPFFWIQERGRPPVVGAHVAFGVSSNREVDAFHAAALAAGGADNGAPGPRPIYHSGYYGAFVLDPDGNNIEAVCHSAPPQD